MAYCLRESDKEDVVDDSRMPWEGVKLVMMLTKACSKLCNKPWEGMFSFFVFRISCHFVLNVGFFPSRLVLFELPSPITSGTMVTVEDLKQELSKYLLVCLTKIIFANLFYYSAYFYYYLWVPLHFLVLFIGLTVPFQLTFIYGNFSKISRSQTDPYCTRIGCCKYF